MTRAARPTDMLVTVASLSMILSFGLFAPGAPAQAAPLSQAIAPTLTAPSVILPTRVTRPRITKQPKSAIINRYGVGTSVKLRVTATGTKLRYQWQYRSGGKWHSIKGATKSTYRVRSSRWTHGGKFRVKVTRKTVRRSSHSATVRVRYPTKTPAKDAQTRFGLSGLRQGVDLSSWQYLPSGRIRMSAVKSWVGTGGFTILRTGSGTRPINKKYVDACTGATKYVGSVPVVEDCAYATFADQARSLGLRTGHYWFNGWISSLDTTTGDKFSGSFSAANSADRYFTWLTTDGNYTKTSTDPLVLDIESGGTWLDSTGKLRQKLRAWTPAEATEYINRLKYRLTSAGYKANVYVYMSSNAASAMSGSTYRWQSVAPIARLWVASWGKDNGRIPDSQPKVGPWASHGGWSIWQYTSNARISGSGVTALDGDIAKSTAWIVK